MEAWGSWSSAAAVAARTASRSARRDGRAGPAARRRSASRSSVARASPTRPCVPGWLRPISSGSTSIWITCCAGLERHRRQPRADGEDDVRPVQMEADRGAGPERGAQREVARVAQRPLALGGHDDGGLQVLGDGAEGIVGAPEVDAAAGHDHRVPRRDQEPDGALELGRRRRRPLGRGRVEEGDLALVLERLRRDVHDDRARPAGPELAGRLADRGGDLRDLEHPVPPLRDGGDRVELVVHLVEEADVQADLRLGDLSRHHEDR